MNEKHIVKWLVVGFLGTLGLFLAFASVLIWKFSPLIEVRQDEGRVRILGGLIDVHEEDEKKVDFIGSQELDGDRGHFDVSFSNGRFSFTTSRDGKLHWRCRTNGHKPLVSGSGANFVMNLSALRGAKCDIEVPKLAHLKVDGGNGKLELSEPRFHADVSLLNGKVGIAPARDEKYRYSTQVMNGMSDTFASNDVPGALDIKVAVTNGKIIRD